MSQPIAIRSQSMSPTGELMEVVATFAPPESPRGPGYAQTYARGLVYSMVRVAAAVATMEGVMRQVCDVRINYNAGHIEIRACVGIDQTPQQVQAEILARVAAVEPVVVTARAPEAAS